jgi:riboflavin kinase/FMN adenylyltransferase
MQITALNAFRPNENGSVVALGFFDGVHLGHQAICRRAVELARHHGTQAIVFTMRDHPATVLRPQLAPLLLTSFDEKCRWLAACGVEGVVWIDFDEAFSQQSPEDFVTQVLLQKLSMRVAVSGASYRFGRGASGTPESLRTLGQATTSFGTETVDAVTFNGEVVSSSLIRERVQAGDMTAAAQLLGHPFGLSSIVEHGEGRGRQIGFATANLRLDPRHLLPADGVYAVRAQLSGEAEMRDGVANLGVRPTFGERKRVLEVHLLTPPGDIYDRPMQVDFAGRLRDEKKFENVEALVRQIQQDVEAARQVLAMKGA